MSRTVPSLGSWANRTSGALLMGILLCLVEIPSAQSAENLAPAQLLQEAEANFAKGVERKNEQEQAGPFFQLAADSYRQLYEQGFRNADLCRNWGQAELLAGNLPQAILAWRLGLALSPGDPELLFHLEYARDQVEYPPGNLCRPAERSWAAWLPWFDLGTVMALAVICYGCLWAIGTGWLICRQTLLLWMGGVCFVFFLAFVTGGVWLLLEERENEAHPLLVIAKAHTLHTGNGTSYAPHEKISVVRPGMEARLLYTRGDWLQIEFAGGHVGWVRRSAVLTGPP